MRPDDLHPAATRPDLPVVTARLDLLEALGTHSVAYFKVEREAFSGTAIVEEEEQEATSEGVTGSRPNLVASVPAREALDLKIGDQVPLAVDVGSAAPLRPGDGCAAALALSGSGSLSPRRSARSRPGRRARLGRCRRRRPALRCARSLSRPRTRRSRPSGSTSSCPTGTRTATRRTTAAAARATARRPGTTRPTRLVPRRRSQGPDRQLHDPQHGLARIRDLGFNAIWTTPVLKQKTCRRGSAAYHGYWGLDFTTVDPHLGTDADYAAFVDCAHRLGMKVILDVVVNHTADVVQLAGSEYNPAAYRDCHGKRSIRPPS